jgi:ubiquinone/menaquinone biosynthesis C-methylase UbiE
MSGHRVCPWWLGYLLACPLRRRVHNAAAILAPYVHEGMTVLEPGPGMGFFTLELGRRVGARGRVVAVDIQPKMLAVLQRRAKRAGVGGQVEARLAPAASLGLDDLAGQVDFALAFAMVHEMPSASAFFADVSRAMKPGARMLVAEPSGHVNDAAFAEELNAAAAAGLRVLERPAIRRSFAAVLVKE